MTLQPAQQTIAIHILPIISRSKVNQTMKLGQLIEHKKRNIFLSKIMQKIRQWKLVSHLSLFFKKAYYNVKVSGLQLTFNIFL